MAFHLDLRYWILYFPRPILGQPPEVGACNRCHHRVFDLQSTAIFLPLEKGRSWEIPESGAASWALAS